MEIVTNKNHKAPNPKKKVIIRVVVTIVAVTLFVFSIFYFDLLPDFKKDKEEVTKESHEIYKTEGIDIENIDDHNVSQDYEIEEETGLEAEAINQKFAEIKKENIKNSKKNNSVRDPYVDNDGNNGGNDGPDLQPEVEDEDDFEIPVEGEPEGPEEPDETPEPTPTKEIEEEDELTEEEIKELEEAQEVNPSVFVNISTELIKSETYKIRAAINKSLNQNSDEYNSILLSNIFNAIRTNILSDISAIDNISYGEWVKVVQNWLFNSPENEFTWKMREKSSGLYRSLLTSGIYKNEFGSISNQAVTKKNNYRVDLYMVNYEMIFISSGKTYKALFGIQDNIPVLLDIKGL